MSDVNVSMIQGRLTRNPELRTTGSGVAVADISIASNRFRRKKGAPADAKGDDAYEKDTTFIKVTLWNQMAERYAKQLKKGDMVLVQGQLVDDSYEDKEGTQHNGRLKLDNVSQVSVLAHAKTTTETSTPSTPPEV